MTDHEVNDVKIYSSLVNDSLLNAELFLTWVDNDAYSTDTKVRYRFKSYF